MDPRGALAAVSAAHLLTMAAGHTIALRDRRPFDIALLGWRGQPENVSRDSWFIGTALSGPIVMHLVQMTATVRLWMGPSGTAIRILGFLGVVMASATVLEQEVRSALSPTGMNARTTPLVAAGLTLALSMAALGLSKGAATIGRDAATDC